MFAGGAWGALATLSTISVPGTKIVAAGGGSAIVALHLNDDTGIRKRTTGTTFTDVGTAHGELLGQYEKTLRVGSGGHAIEVWRASDTTMGTALIDPTGTTVTPLPDNPVSGQISRTSAVIDAAGDGFAFWHDASTNDLVGRAFRAGAWKGDAAKLAVGGAAFGLDAALLPNGDAYVIWSRSDGSPGVHGATIHLETGTSTSTWSAVDVLTGTGSAPHRILAAVDGELTALWGQNDGSGTAKLTARRKPAGGAWGAPATLGKTTGKNVVYTVCR